METRESRRSDARPGERTPLFTCWRLESRFPGAAVVVERDAMDIDPMKRLALALALLFLPAAACDAATNAANGAGSLVEKTALSIEHKTNDAAITVAVKGALVDADEVLGRQVKVGTYNSVVSLSGTVPTPELKARAEQIALQARGVVKVLNALDVGPLQ